MAGSEPPSHKEFFGLGTLLLMMTLLPGWAPAGPWGNPSFSRGIVGLIGASIIYVAWYRYTFKISGIIPELSMWKEPTKSRNRLAILGISLFIFSFLIGHYLDFVPIPFTLIMTLISLLMMLLSGYAWLVFEGPLQDPEEE
jgi:hypothetical protein